MVDTDSPEYKKYRREIARRYRQAHPEKKIARNAGQILQKKPCEFLIQGNCSGQIEAHHDNYKQPWKVRWLCKFHHEQVDTELDRAKKSDAKE
jgi:hypothetical protein